MSIRNVRHIYSQALDIRVGPLRVCQFNLNRHLPERDSVDDHAHRHAQFLLYLTGTGRQQIAGTDYEVRPGVLFFLPPGCGHSFTEGEGRRPLCLAIDLLLPEAMNPLRAVLTQAGLQSIRQALSKLHQWHPGTETIEPREAAAVLQILDVLMRGCGLIQTRAAHTTLPIVRRVREVFREKIENPAPVAQVAELVGYHRDHLTRILRRETGMSAGQLRASETLKRAKTLLAAPGAIAEVAEKCGFTDPNYFSRWFRKQTGTTPRGWRETGGE